MRINKKVRNWENKIKKIVIHYFPSLFKAEVVRNFKNTYSKMGLRPRFAVINITDRCCFRCIMCTQWKNSSKDEFTTQQWKDVIWQLKKENIKEIVFSGGEPLLRRDISELIEYATSLNIQTGLQTNGYLLDEVKIKELVDVGLNSFTVSVDAIGDKFDKIRGFKGAFKKVKKACELLSNLEKSNNIFAGITFVLMKPTLECLEDVVVFAKKYSLPLAINLLDYTPYFFQNEENKNDFWIREEENKELHRLLMNLAKEKKDNYKIISNSYVSLEYIRDYFKDPVQAHIPCSISQVRIFIDPKGQTFGGCWSMGPYGNLKEKSLEKILNSSKYKKAHERMFFKKCPGCSCGYLHNLRYYFPFLIREAKLNFLSKIKENMFNNYYED